MSKMTRGRAAWVMTLFGSLARRRSNLKRRNGSARRSSAAVGATFGAVAALAVATAGSALAFELNPDGESQICWFSDEPESDWYKVGGSQYHAGDDTYADDWNRVGGISADCGEPVHPSCDGEVIFVGDVNNGYGNQVIVQCSANDSFAVRAAHLESVNMSKGQYVSHPDIIGYVGMTGGVKSCHLHLVLYKNIFSPSAIDGETGLSRLRQGRTPNGALTGPATTFSAKFYPDDEDCS